MGRQTGRVRRDGDLHVGWGHREPNAVENERITITIIAVTWLLCDVSPKVQKVEATLVFDTPYSIPTPFLSSCLFPSVFLSLSLSLSFSLFSHYLSIYISAVVAIRGWRSACSLPSLSLANSFGESRSRRQFSRMSKNLSSSTIRAAIIMKHALIGVLQ